MNAKGERVRGWTDRVNVSALPFIAGVALTISGVLSFVLGLYTFNRWFGWCFIVLGVLLSVTGLALDRGADVRCDGGAVPRDEDARPERNHRGVDGDHADADR